MKQSPSNVLIKVIVAILLLFSCYLIGTVIFNVIGRNDGSYKESSQSDIYSNNNNYGLIRVASQNFFIKVFYVKNLHQVYFFTH